MPADAYHRVDDPDCPGCAPTTPRSTPSGSGGGRFVTHSASLHAAQSRGFDQTLDKARDRLGALQVRLAARRTRRDRGGRGARDRADLRAAVGRRGAHRHPHRHHRRRSCGCGYRTDRHARRQLEDRIFGKRILFTNRTDWPVARVIAAYRSQSDIESGFRQLKDPQVISFSPMHHWTDQKIRVHVFYSVLALTIAHLMRREAADAGLHLSVRELLAELAGIEETVLALPRRHQRSPPRPTNAHRPQRHRRTTARLFGIDRYAPTR
ncbi:hypothetical protein FXW78_49150 [Rhodococcus opacus]|nr:hypothetical protein [Rhodococcus opacus]